MRRFPRVFVTGLAVCCVAVGGLALSAVPALAAAPEVLNESVSSVTPFEARLEALVNAGEESTECHFQYGKTVTEHEVSCEQGEGLLEGGEQEVGVTVTGLEPGTPYRYRVLLKNATSEAEGAGEFTTQAPPVVTTGEAQSITQTTATFSGTVNPFGAATTYHFAYIDQAGYEKALAEEKANPYAEGETTAPVSAGSSYEPQAVGPILASGMLPGETYHYALVAENEVAVTIGQPEIVKTLPGTPPTVSTGGASGVSQNTATLSGTVSTNSLQTEYGFEIGTEAGQYDPATGLGSLGGTTTETVALTLGELQPGTTYYYRITATNADGTEKGQPASFTTPGFPALIAPPASPPQIGTPNIAFPTGSQENTGTIETKKPTNAQKLGKALKACKKYKSKHKRANCEKQAHKTYRSSKKTKKQK